MNGLRAYIKGDKVIWAIIFMLSILSLLVVYSATGTLAYKYQKGNTEYYMIKHAMILLFGIALIIMVHKVKYTWFSRLSQVAIFLAAPLLLLTLLKGANLNEASRWLAVPGTGLTFQTSDFAKIALIAYLSRILSQKQDKIKDFKTGFIPVMIPVLIICGLILPANFSTAAVLFLTSLVLMFVGRVNIKYLFSLIGVGIVFLSLFIVVVMNSGNTGRVGTWKKRIENFTSGDSKGNYQVEQAKIAIATGGFFGKGPGKSTQRNFLPHPYSDFIYAIIIEEYGMFFGLLIVFLYLILLLRGIRTSIRADKLFGSLLAFGCSFSLVFQAMINMAVAVNLGPVTGQPLPMLSMGGTSIWFTCLSIGLILSVSAGELSEPTQNKEEEFAHA
jgi:cell division protein FtsW